MASPVWNSRQVSARSCRGEIGGAIGENLTQRLDWLPQARALDYQTLDVELPVTLDDLALAPAGRPSSPRSSTASSSRPGGGIRRLGCAVRKRRAWLPPDTRGPPAPPHPERLTRHAERHYETILTFPQLDSRLERVSRRAARLVRHRNDPPSIRCGRGSSGLPLVAVEHRARGLFTFRLPTTTPAPRRNLSIVAVLAHLKPWLEDEHAAEKARSEPQIRRPRARQPRNPGPRRDRPRHAAPVLRAGKPQASRLG